MKFLRTYFLPIMIAFAMLLFFTHDFGLIDIEHTAIIVAMGVDKTDKEYEVSTKIAIPQATTQNVSNNDSLISAKGKTIAEALDKIAVNTGWYPLFAFCNLIILGENTLNGNIMDTVNYFIRTDRVPDSATVCACEGTAKELLLTNTPLDSVSSFAMQKILQQDYAKMNRIANVNVKQFVEKSLSKSETAYFPYVSTVKSGEKSESGSSGGSGGSSGGSGGSSGGSGGSGGQGENGQGGNESSVYDATNTVVFSKGRKVFFLSPEETLMLNLKSKNSIDTFIKLDEVNYEGKITPVLIEIEDSKKDFYFEFDDKRPVYNIKMILYCRIVSANASAPVSELYPSAKVSDDILEATEKKMKDTLTSLYKKSQLVGCDIFGIKDELYKYHYKKYDGLKDDVLSATALNLEITCRSKTTTRN